MDAHSWDDDDAETKHQLTFPQFHKPSLYLLTPTCYPDMWRKISLLTVEQSQILTPGFSHLTVKWVCVSAAVPFSAPLRLSVCLCETEERQTMERRCCKVAPSAWRCWKVEKRICSVAHLKSRAAGRRPTLQFFQVTGCSEGRRKVGVKEVIHFLLCQDLCRSLSGCPPSPSQHLLFFWPTGYSAGWYGWNQCWLEYEMWKIVQFCLRVDECSLDVCQCISQEFFPLHCSSKCTFNLRNNSSQFRQKVLSGSCCKLHVCSHGLKTRINSVGPAGHLEPDWSWCCEW